MVMGLLLQSLTVLPSHCHCGQLLDRNTDRVGRQEVPARHLAGGLQWRPGRAGRLDAWLFLYLLMLNFTIAVLFNTNTIIDSSSSRRWIIIYIYIIYWLGSPSIRGPSSGVAAGCGAVSKHGLAQGGTSSTGWCPDPKANAFNFFGTTLNFCEGTAPSEAVQDAAAAHVHDPQGLKGRKL